MKAGREFPNNSDLILQQIKQFIYTNQLGEARRLRDASKKKFTGNHQFTQLMQNAFNKIKPISDLAYQPKKISFQSIPLKVKLPPIIAAIFKLLEKLLGEYYLAGSTVMKLVRQLFRTTDSSKAALTDFDILSNASPDHIAKLPGVRKSQHIPNLYHLPLTLDGQTVIIDMVLEKAGKDWLLNNAIKRDLTACSLFIDKSGTIVDPIGRCVRDIELNRLDTTCYYPFLLFEENPPALIRAILYIVYGFTPTPDLEYALHHWSGNNLAPHYSHLLAMLIKNIETKPDLKLEYVQKLHHFGVLAKILQDPLPLLEIAPDAMNVETVNHLLIELRHRYEQQHTVSFFNRPNMQVIAPAEVDELVENIKKEKENDKEKEKEPENVVTKVDYASWPTLFRATQHTSENMTPPGDEKDLNPDLNANIG